MNKDDLIKGEFYLYKVPRQATGGADLHSVYFITENNRTYEVVFTRHDAGNPTPAWYLVETKPEIQEGEVVEQPFSDTLEVRVEDEMDVTALFGGGGGQANPEN